MSQLSLRKGFAFAAALLLVGAAIAIAVATRGSGSSSARTELTRFAKADPDAQATAKDKPGESQPGAVQAAIEDYAHRAYPGTEVPFSATRKAIKSYTDLESAGTFTPVPGQWNLAGPNGEQYPDSLTFFGKPYVASGRITALAIDPACNSTTCRLWVAAAGGGIWRTNAATGPAASLNWQRVSDAFDTNAIGTLTFAGGVLYAGTGEPNASGDSEAGVGIYKSTDGGTTWVKLPSTTHTVTAADGDYTGDAFANRSISSIVVDPTNPNVLYVGSARGVRGVSSVTGNGTSNPPTPRPAIGLYKSTNGGSTFTFIWDGNASVRGVNHVALDPTDHTIVYAAAFQQGIWRSLNGGSTFTQMYAPVAPGENTDRAEFDVNTLPNGNTRMYVGDGSQASSLATQAQVFRTDNAKTATPASGWINLTTSQNRNYCTGQCWYDNFVISPPGRPAWVYIGGSFDYNSYFSHSDGRGVLLSTDHGQNWTDMTADANFSPTPANNCCNPNAVAQDALHPDQHALVINPSSPTQFFEGSDGGLMRSQGGWQDISGQCASRPFQDNLALCQQLLSRVPTLLTSMNVGLPTLQFQSLSVDRFNSQKLMGGTQDNGTMQGIANVWPQIIYGDGGLSGWNAANQAIRFNSFFGQFHDANVDNGDPTQWYIIGGPIAASPEASNFYAPIIPDPNPTRAGTIFEGSQSVWRTQDWGGDPTTLKANCPEFFTSGATPTCGDFVQIGNPSSLTGTGYGSDRTACCVSWLARPPYPQNKTDTGTLWAATNGGRVFITKNADAANPAAVVWTRLDTLPPSLVRPPQRSITSIYVDPFNTDHAWISYTGYNFNTPSSPGHVFSVTYDPVAGAASWTNLDGGSLSDLPVTSVVYDDVTGDLYASTDFGVVRLPNGSSTWTVAAQGMPNGEVAGLTIVPQARKLYAATHGMSAWLLPLP